MTQESLPFGRIHMLEDGHRRLLRVIEHAVGAVHPIVAAGAVGADQNDLRKAMDNLDGSGPRHMRTRWAQGVALVAPADARRAIARAFVQPLGFDIVDEKPMSKDEIIAAYEAQFAAMGEMGLDAMSRARSRRGR